MKIMVAIHSLRSGGASAAATNNVNERLISMEGGSPTLVETDILKSM